MRKYIFLAIFLELFLFSALVLAPSFSAAQGTVDIFNPVKIRGVETPGQMVFLVFQGFAGLIGVFAVTFMVFSGFKLVIATNEESIKNAREGVKWSVFGFAAAIMSFAIIAAAQKFLGFDVNQIVGPGGTGYDRLGPVLFFWGAPQSDFISVMNYIMINLLGLIGFATTLMIIYYGYRYITSAGSEEAIEQAKTGLKWAVIGLAITLLSFTVINSVQQYLVRGTP